MTDILWLLIKKIFYFGLFAGIGVAGFIMVLVFLIAGLSR